MMWFFLPTAGLTYSIMKDMFWELQSYAMNTEHWIHCLEEHHYSTVSHVNIGTHPYTDTHNWSSQRNWSIPLLYSKCPYSIRMVKVEHRMVHPLTWQWYASPCALIQNPWGAVGGILKQWVPDRLSWRLISQHVSLELQCSAQLINPWGGAPSMGCNHSSPSIMSQGGNHQPISMQFIFLLLSTPYCQLTNQGLQLTRETSEMMR